LRSRLLDYHAASSILAKTPTVVTLSTISRRPAEASTRAEVPGLACGIQTE
jgi:hypothetical protein